MLWRRFLCGMLALSLSATALAFGWKGIVASATTVHGEATANTDLPAAQRIIVHRNAGNASDAWVSVGIPFPPGALRDAHLVRILDEHGAEVPAAVQTTLLWYAKDHSIRAVRAQFHVDMAADAQTFYFSTSQMQTHNIAMRPYADGLVDGAHGVKVAAVLATLSPEWLCASLIAGPQVPAEPDEAYANYVSAQFEWAKALPVKDPTAWLFDRPSTLFKAYVRTGRFDYLQAADESYHFYMKYIRRDGFAMSPFCAGGWTYNDKPCDVKYVYVEPILLSLALTGDDSEHDAATVDKMMTLWQNGGWGNRPGAYTAPSQHFTERMTGLGLLETVSAYELTGDQRYLDRVNDRVGWLYDHQRNNPDKLGDDGSWRNSWNLHEDDSWNPSTDVRGTSPWMSENIVDGLWHAWLVTNDPRIPTMITDFGRYLERYGWIKPELLHYEHDWRNPCSGPNGQIAWYWSSSQASPEVLSHIEASDGWYSDAHTVEIALPVAAAYYFERDPKQSAALKHRLDAITASYSAECAKTADTLRRFNWNNRGAGAVAWLIRQPPGSGANTPVATSARP